MKATYVKQALSLALIIFCASVYSWAQTDTIRLYKGGPDYVLSHNYTSSPLPDCFNQLTDAAYSGAAYNASMNGKKKGDTYVWQTLTGESYKFTSKDMQMKNGPNNDTITPQKVLNAEIQLTKTTISQNVEIYVFGDVSNTPKNWILITCKARKDTALTVVKKYSLHVDEAPIAISNQLKVCNYGTPISLITNIDKQGGSFSYAPKGQSFMASKPLTEAVFNPANYSIGSYTIFYQKKYDNDPNKSLTTTFGVEVFSLPINLKATPVEIRQGEHVAFEPVIDLPKGDSVWTAEWDYGDGTARSKLIKPFHYYVDTGTMTISLRLTTKNGCRQSSTQKSAVYVDYIPIEVTTDTRAPGLETYYNTNENDTHLYPNPSTGLFHFTAYNTLESVKVVVYRLSDGLTVFEGLYKDLRSMDIDLGQEGAGMFLCVLKQPNGSEIRYKLIKT